MVNNNHMNLMFYVVASLNIQFSLKGGYLQSQSCCYIYSILILACFSSEDILHVFMTGFSMSSESMCYRKFHSGSP